jgi:hypothetical protein
MKPFHPLLLFALCGLFASLNNVSARQWVSRDGKFKVQADLLRFDGLVAALQRADGSIANVPVDRLSPEDREFLWTQVDDPRFAAAIPPALKTFKKVMQGMRPIEIRRIEARMDQLRKELRSGVREIKHPVGQQAKALMRHLAQRLNMLNSGAAFIPTLSPKDFRVGQIGKLDDDLQFSIRAEPDGGELPISVTFLELRHTNDIGNVAGFRNSWHQRTVSRPDLMFLKADFVDRLPKTHLDRDPKSPANRMLRAHVYQVTELRPRGAAKDYVLEPFVTDDNRSIRTGAFIQGNVIPTSVTSCLSSTQTTKSPKCPRIIMHLRWIHGIM